MVTASQYPDLVVEDLVNQSMLLIDASGPAILQVVLRRFRFAKARKGFLLNFPNQANDAKGLRSTLFHPPGEVLKSGDVKRQVSQ